MRVCAAAGCESFITSTGCVDVWDPKVLRCAAGGHFHVPIYYNLSWEEIKKLIANKKIFLADSNTSGMWKFVNFLKGITVFFVMFKKRAGVFAPSVFRPDKTRAATFLNGFKNIHGKTCVNRVHNNYAFSNVGN